MAKFFLKKALVVALAATLTFGSTTSALAATKSPTTSVTAEDAAKVSAESKFGVEPVVDTAKNGTAKVVSVTKTAKKSVTISSKLTVDGVDYKITSISAKAFANCTKVDKITLPKTITTIEKAAFSGTPSTLKQIVFTNRKAITLNSGVFNGVDTKKLTISVTAYMSKTEYNKFVANLKAAGFEGTIKQLKK